jgi:hypothetical protein
MTAGLRKGLEEEVKVCSLTSFSVSEAIRELF